MRAAKSASSPTRSGRLGVSTSSSMLRSAAMPPQAAAAAAATACASAVPRSPPASVRAAALATGLVRGGCDQRVDGARELIGVSVDQLERLPVLVRLALATEGEL